MQPELAVQQELVMQQELAVAVQPPWESAQQRHLVVVRLEQRNLEDLQLEAKLDVHQRNLVVVRLEVCADAQVAVSPPQLGAQASRMGTISPLPRMCLDSPEPEPPPEPLLSPQPLP